MDRPPAPITKKAAQNKAYGDHLGKVWDAMAGVPTKPAEQRPEATPPQQTDGFSAEDRAALAQAPPATRAMIDRHVATHREHYGAVDELGSKWSTTLAQRGAATPADQVAHLDRLLETEHTLVNGSPAQKIAAMQEIAHAYGVGAPQAQPQMQPHQAPPQMQPPPAPPSTGNALQDELQRSHHEQQMEAWGQAMQQAGPEAAMQQRVSHAQDYIKRVATATKQDGAPAFPYFAYVGPQMHAVIANQMQNGQRPDLVSAYHDAVAMRPDIPAAPDERAATGAAGLPGEKPDHVRSAGSRPYAKRRLGASTHRHPDKPGCDLG